MENQQKTPLEPWQQEALTALLAVPTKDVEDDRVYLSSEVYGKARYHFLTQGYGGEIIIDQTNIDEKWGSRVTIQRDEVPAFLKTLLDWYLAANAPGEDLGELDDHPF